MFKIPGDKAHRRIGALTIGVSSLGNTSGTSGPVLGPSAQVILAGGNNITLSQSVVRNSATITISAQSQSNQTVGGYAISNTTGQSSSSSFDGRSLTFSGSDAAFVGLSAGSLQINVPAGGGTALNTLGISNIGNTSGTSGVISGQNLLMVVAGGNNVTLSQSIDGSSATVTISKQNETLGFYASSQTVGESSSTTLDSKSVYIAGMGDVFVGLSAGSVLFFTPKNSISFLNPVMLDTLTSTLTVTNSVIFTPFDVALDASFCRVDVLGILTGNTSFGLSTNSTGAKSATCNMSQTIGLYTLGTGASTRSLVQSVSSSFSLGFRHSQSVSSAAGPNLSGSITFAIDYCASLDSTGGITTSSISTSTSQASAASSLSLSNPFSAYIGTFMAPCPFATSISGGIYWFANRWNSTFITGGAANAVNYISFQQYVLSDSGVVPAGESVVTAAVNPGWGGFISAGLPSIVGLSQISMGTAGRQAYFALMNATYGI